ncbi:MAG: zinc ribbon domain-containing protein [Betaproteobacteria bacterium]|nr:MAG: zinc ribbon domain-containing protein [Betaproteobacteria bacterium]
MLNPMPSTTYQPGKAAKPPPHLCPQCAHSNTPDARFCNACGVPLPVMTCPQCGAVNPAAAVSCHQCRGALQDGGADALESAAAAVVTHEPLSRPPIPVAFWVVSAGILVTLAFLGYHAYQTFFYVDIPFERATLPAREGFLEQQRGPSYSGTISRAPAVVDESAEMPVRDAAAPAMPTSNAETAPGSAARTPVNTRRVDRLTAEPCTEDAAAAGLCSQDLKRAKAAEASAKAETAIAPPPPKAIRKAAERAPAGAQPCTAGMWALGLCKTESVQPKE